MKAVKSKSQERLEIERQIQDFLQHGGRVQAIQAGVSGRDPGSYKLPPATFQHQPRMPRTLLLEEIRAIEARRHSKPGGKGVQKTRPRRVLITDDFGEPLRWSWTET